MPRARSDCKDGGRRRFYLFERCSGGILNLRFDSDIFESFYSDCSFPRTRDRFRFGTVAAAIVCGIWLVYFAVLRPHLWYSYVTGLGVCGIISILFCAISFAAFFKKRCLWISGAYAFVSSMFVLLPYIPRVSPVSLTFNLSIVIQLILLTYIMNPLRLWQQLLVCGPLSLLQIILSATRFGAIGGSAVSIHVVAHLCVHSIGIVLHLMSQVWRRSTFLRLGYNALMRKELKREQELRNDMIRSLMPSEVAQEVMRDVGNDEEDDGTDCGEGSSGVTRGKNRGKRSGKHTKKNKMTSNPSADEFGAAGMGLSDEFEEDEDDSEVHKKRSTASNSEWDGRGPPPEDAEAASGSPRASLATKTTGPPRAVTFRKFHVSQLENVSVLFADIVGFTKMSSNKSASHLVYLLNDLFGR
ncbi:Adenylate cyclase type 9 [Fasciola gigantica]|uniref:adenylate cyclase n=1 Tax=Fasciola gigantica TaxID=46835 RepID=A0A504YQW2_FASGI|nr:Adenylate cyclase type 9 [Fasciola gigantica]